ncbi:MAG: RnfABCDGE type electron transport complex subunit B, partial [Anaerofustis stercorihominis]|nr:RnfABCDGE type electron transport complex subunit B [Anaerofustis stercorihominis]
MAKSIIIAAASIGILGAALGLILAFASKIFHVEKDERIDLVLACLPGANCGGCGMPGCGGAAEAIVTGKAPINVCPVGGADAAAKIAEVMGVEAVAGAKQVAFVACQGCKEVAKDKFNYYGAKDCREAAAVMGGEKACEYGCL